jgi:hypothetical protein
VERAASDEGGVPETCTKFQAQNLRERTTWRPKSKLKDNIKMNIKDTEYEGLGWIHMVRGTDQQQVLVSTAMNLRIP